MGIPLRILWIEASEANLNRGLQVLHNSGYQPVVVRVDHPNPLQHQLQQHRWDVVLSAAELPGLTALQALQILQAVRPDLPFIVLSQPLGERAAVALLKAGASDYLPQTEVQHLGLVLTAALRQAEAKRKSQQAEITLRQQAAIVEAAEDALISTDVSGRVLIWNRGAERLYGYTAAEAVGQSLVSLIQPEAELRWAIPLRRFVMQVTSCRQVLHRHKTGKLLDVLLTISLMREAGEVVGFAVVARDISRQSTERLKDEFVSIINHELRTPLTSLQGSIELLLTGKLGELSHQGRRMLEIAAKNLDRLVHLTNNILDLEGLSSGRIQLSKQPCYLEQVMTQAAAKLQPIAAQKGIRLIVVSQELLLTVDAQRIQQVLTNLLKNAIQFSRPGSRVWLEAEVSRAGFPGLPDGPHVLIRVKDEGQGIPADKLDAIFEQFQQVDASDSRRQGGAGLGLAICRNIVQQHQGHLWVESRLGCGSTFYIALPAQHVVVPACVGNTKSN